MAYDFNSLTKQANEATNRDGFYTDFEDVDPSKLHQITELTEWMRTKAKGSDVREVIAQLFERTWVESIKEGNANLEVAQARGSYPNLKSRLDNVDNKQQKTTEQLAKKANKDEVTNVMTPKGTLAYALLPKSGNQVGWYYYCPDGDGTHGAGNYVWNGTSWYFGGTGDEGYNLLKEDLDKLENEIYFDSEYQTDVTSNGTLDTTKKLQLNLNSNRVVLTNGTNGVIKFSVRSGEKYSIDGISECSSDPTYPTVTLAFTSDETTLITSSDGGYSYDLDATSVTDVKNYIVTVPNNAKYMYVSNRGINGAKVRIIKKTTNNLTGKKLGILGDSIAYGYGFGGGFGGIIANNNGMTIQNVAVSGACISVGMKSSDNTDIPCIYDQVELLDDDCDIVVFDGCFNDRGIIEDGRTTLGTITSIGWFGTNEPDTFCHCFENLLEALVQKFHGKPILYVYHHPIQRANDTVHESVLQMLEKWSIPYVDLSNASGGMITQIGTIKNTYTVGDTVHPNELGYKKYYVPQITAKMKTLL